MEIREIQAFIVLAEELNFSKAAERLHMSQPPLTRLISKLEFDLGVKLLNRTTRKVELTGAGLHLLRRGKDILSTLEGLEKEVRSLNKNKTGKLRISLQHSSFHSNIPHLINVFKQQFPRINLELIEVPLHQVTKQLNSGKIDIAFLVNDLRHEGLTRIEVQTQELGLLISRDHPLAKKKAIQLKDLLGETLIFHGKHDALGFQGEFLEYLESKGIRAQVYYKKPKEGCPQLVVAGRGLLLTSRKMISSNHQSRFVPFADYSSKLKIDGMWNKENSSLELRAFLHFLSENSSLPRNELESHF